MTVPESLESQSDGSPPVSFLPGSPFGGILGQSSELKVLDFVLGFPTKDFNVSELAREADLSRPSARSVLYKLLDWGILEGAGVRAGSRYFKLNETSDHVASLREFLQATNELIVGKLGFLTTAQEPELVSAGVSSLLDYLPEIGASFYAHQGTQTETTPPLALASLSAAAAVPRA
jgi:hypothetical protein